LMTTSSRDRCLGKAALARFARCGFSMGFPRFPIESGCWPTELAGVSEERCVFCSVIY
jgi:hypothetical protein